MNTTGFVSGQHAHNDQGHVVALWLAVRERESLVQDNLNGLFSKPK
jgi:hypothetical protein